MPNLYGGTNKPWGECEKYVRYPWIALYYAERKAKEEGGKPWIMSGDVCVSPRRTKDWSIRIRNKKRGAP